MSQFIKEILRTNRPKSFDGRGDKYLPDIAMDIRRQILRASRDFKVETLVLEDEALDTASVLLAEFAEDLHNDAGIWRSLENWNRELFGTPLPFFTEPGEPDPELAVFDERRVGYFLWNIYPILHEGLILSPTHHDLRQLAKALSAFLPGRFAAVPRDSSVAKLLASSNDFGREVKRKLIWLGGSSYLFRDLWWDYLRRSGTILSEDRKIEIMDDFLNQECTMWSGLGVIDILAGVLDISEEDRTDLRSWHSRHTALYKVLEVERQGTRVERIRARNLISGSDYTVRIQMENSPFVEGFHVFGALVPWRGEWYWSGNQRGSKTPSAEQIQTIRRTYLESQSHIAYRYCLPELEKAREMARIQHRNFVEHHGSDFVEFPDGLSMAAAEQARMRRQWESAPKEKVDQALQAAGKETPGTDMEYPPEVLNHTGGIAVFSHPDEGIEIAVNFHPTKSGLEKRGSGLIEREMKALHGLMTDQVLSPAFVRLLVTRHGAESIVAFFNLHRQPPDLALDFLLRRHKGAHFRPRYPSISVVD
jgi:hypothetical protein